MQFLGCFTNNNRAEILDDDTRSRNWLEMEFICNHMALRVNMGARKLPVRLASMIPWNAAINLFFTLYRLKNLYVINNE